MTLSAGTRLGVFEVIAKLGEGGMGEVYRARDTRLDRDVAIKILPSVFAADPDRLTRFEREAKALAALNHPNIAHIHGLEEHRMATGETVRALVMELIEGEDLSQRLARGPLPLVEALPMARQLADALEAAHEHGIIHRDLKPANIKVRDDGTVKVLDFGLAKALDPAGASASGAATNSPTLTARATQLGLILGTAAYMAPEQARGKVVDRRADIWSFGVVVAESLTGQRAFSGDDISEVLARVIEREPDLSALPASTPPALTRLLSRCLAKDPKQRLRDIGEARIALDDAQRELTQGPGPATAAPAAADGGPRSAGSPLWRLAPWLLAVAALVVVGVLLSRDASTPALAGGANGVTRLQIALPPSVELYTAVGAAVSLSPDASTLAFVGVRAGVRQVFLRRLDAFDVTPLRGTAGAVSCVFSLDGSELLVGTSDTALRRVRLADNLVEVITPQTSEYYGGWLEDGRAVFTLDGRLWVSGALPGAAPARVTDTPSDDPTVEAQPFVVPGTNTLLFAVGRPELPEASRIDALLLGTGQRTTVVERASSPLVTSSGHILFVRDGALLAAPFDGQAMRLTGEASPVLRDVSVVRNRGVAPILTVSRSGTLVYGGATAAESELVIVSREGQEALVLRVDRMVVNPRLAPNGRVLMFEELGGGLWLYDRTRRTLGRLTDGATLAAFPIFTRDGASVVYRSPSGMHRMPVDGSARPELIQGSEASEFPTGFSLDGADVIYTKIGATTAGDLRLLPLAGGTPRVLLSTSAYEGGAQLSPDGRWIVYVSNELGGSEVFMQPYPAMDRRFQVSSSGGLHPVWNPRGGEIFYRSADRMMSVKMSVTADGPVLAPPVELFAGRYAFGGGLTIPNFAVTADGDQFVMVKEQSGAHLNVVLNWFEELKRLK